MKFTKWMIAGALGVFVVSVNPTVIIGQGNGNGHSKGHNKHDDDDEQSERYYKHHEGEATRDWYYENEGHLPPRAGQERSTASRSGKAARAARLASSRAPETHPALSRGTGVASASSSAGLRKRHNRRTRRSAEPQNKYRRGHLSF